MSAAPASFTVRAAAIFGLLLAALALLPAGALATGGTPEASGSASTSAAFPADGFLSPDKKIWCQQSDGEVGCVALRRSRTPGYGAVAKRSGRVTLCAEKAGKNAYAEWDCFQNFDESAPVLPYGKRAEAGGFRCASARKGITCTVVATGKGFLIDKNEALRVG
jgi:hypothetical protein